MAPAREKTRPWSDHLPLWLHATLPFLVTAALAALLVGAGLVVKGGKERNLTVRVIRFGLVETGEGASSFAYVALPDGRPAHVWLPRAHQCRVGSALTVSESKGFFSKIYTVRGRGCHSVAGGSDGRRGH